MKSILGVFFLFFYNITLAQQNEVFRIQSVMNKQVSAWNRGNIEEFMEGYWKSDSLKFIGKNGITHGWEATLNKYRKGYPSKEDMGQLHFSDLVYQRLCNNYFLVTGSWHLMRKKDKLSGWFSLFFKKIGKNWFIVIDHTS